jgi:hypothetical protein
MNEIFFYEDQEGLRFSVWTYCFLAVTVVNALINPNYILRKIFKFKSNEADTATLTFKEFVKKLKPSTYNTFNPVDHLKTMILIYKERSFLDNCISDAVQIQLDEENRDEKYQLSSDDIAVKDKDSKDSKSNHGKAIREAISKI